MEVVWVSFCTGRWHLQPQSYPVPMQEAISRGTKMFVRWVPEGSTGVSDCW
jgi:hypothetical protein